MLQDDSVVHMLQHPPPVFLAALRHADAERCLNTLQPIFDISYPRELRLAQLEEWRTTYAERIVNACERARCELNRAPAFPPQPPLAVRCGTPPQRSFEVSTWTGQHGPFNMSKYNRRIFQKYAHHVERQC